jgi:lysozyme
LRAGNLCATFRIVSTLGYSKTGLALTEHFEADGGPVLKAYWDALGKVWTIGYGSTGPDIHEGLVWTPEQCEARLLRDVQNACLHVNHLVTTPLNQNQFDALVDFAYNVGCGAFASSTLLKDVNEGNMQAAENEFGRCKG